MLFENEWYFESSVGIQLRGKGLDIVEEQLKDKRCLVCGGPLRVATAMEGSWIECVADHNHKAGWAWEMPPNEVTNPDSLYGMMPPVVMEKDKLSPTTGFFGQIGTFGEELALWHPWRWRDRLRLWLSKMHIGRAPEHCY